MELEREGLVYPHSTSLRFVTEDNDVIERIKDTLAMELVDAFLEKMAAIGYATLMYKYGKADIRSLQQILGHESIATTESYTHIDDSQLQAVVNSNPLAIMFS